VAATNNAPAISEKSTDLGLDMKFQKALFDQHWLKGVKVSQS
jgi:hypothetical protein